MVDSLDTLLGQLQVIIDGEAGPDDVVDFSSLTTYASKTGYKNLAIISRGSPVDFKIYIDNHLYPAIKALGENPNFRTLSDHLKQNVDTLFEHMADREFPPLYLLKDNGEYVLWWQEERQPQLQETLDRLQKEFMDALQKHEEMDLETYLHYLADGEYMDVSTPYDDIYALYVDCKEKKPYLEEYLDVAVATVVETWTRVRETMYTYINNSRDNLGLDGVELTPNLAENLTYMRQDYSDLLKTVDFEPDDPDDIEIKNAAAVDPNRAGMSSKVLQQASCSSGQSAPEAALRSLVDLGDQDDAYIDDEGEVVMGGESETERYKREMREESERKREEERIRLLGEVVGDEVSSAIELLKNTNTRDQLARSSQASKLINMVTKEARSSRRAMRGEAKTITDTLKSLVDAYNANAAASGQAIASRPTQLTSILADVSPQYRFMSTLSGSKPLKRGVTYQDEDGTYKQRDPLIPRSLLWHMQAAINGSEEGEEEEEEEEGDDGIDLLRGT